MTEQKSPDAPGPIEVKKDPPAAPEEAKPPTPPVVHHEEPPPPPAQHDQAHAEAKHNDAQAPEGSPAKVMLANLPEQPHQKQLSKKYDGYALDDQSYLQQYTHLNGGAPVTDGGLGQGPTQKAEADVLNAIRKDHRKLDPVYLAELQTKIGVANNSGAMNTETLRMLRKVTNRPTLGAEDILKGDVLVGILPGKPIIATAAVSGGGALGSAADVGARSRADGMARAAGFESYSAMRDHWVKDIKLLDISLPGGGMPALAQRVAVADAFLKNRYQKDHDAGMSWKDIAHQKLHWSGRGNAAYGASAAQIEQYGSIEHITVGPHMHSAGFALDIDGSQNPGCSRRAAWPRAARTP